MDRAYESKKPKLEAHPSNKWTQNQRKQMDQIQKINNIIIAQWTRPSNRWTQNQSSFFLRLLARSKPRWQFSVKQSTLHCVGSSFGEQVVLDMSEWFLGVRVFWSGWEWVFYIICVRVTVRGDVGYDIVTVGIIGG